MTAFFLSPRSFGIGSLLLVTVSVIAIFPFTSRSSQNFKNRSSPNSSIIFIVLHISSVNTIFVLLTAVNESEENGLTAKASESFWTSSANRSLKDSASSWCFLYIGLSNDEDCLLLLSSNEARMFDSSLPQSSHLCREESSSRFRRRVAPSVPLISSFSVHGLGPEPLREIRTRFY